MRPIVDQIASHYDPADRGVLRDAAEGPATEAWHDACAARLPALAALEMAAAPAPQPPKQRLRIAAWNAERLKYAEPSAALIASTGADVTLLSEVDIGMARSGNRHTVRELAATLRSGFVYGVEFVELGLGDEREMRWHRGEINQASYHGNAIVSPLVLADPFLIPVDDGGYWFTGEGDPTQRRLGGRNAIVARVVGWTKPLWVVSVHLENRCPPAMRADQAQRLLATLDERIGGDAVIIGGDLNTNELPPAVGDKRSLPLTAGGLRGASAELDRAEPLFGVMAATGYEMADANLSDITQRARPDGTPPAPYRRIDWIFTRGLKASGPRTVAAVDETGIAISDHDLILVDIEPD